MCKINDWVSILINYLTLPILIIGAISSFFTGFDNHKHKKYIKHKITNECIENIKLVIKARNSIYVDEQHFKLDSLGSILIQIDTSEWDKYRDILEVSSRQFFLRIEKLEKLLAELKRLSTEVNISFGSHYPNKVALENCLTSCENELILKKYKKFKGV